MISLEKLAIFTPLQKLPYHLGDLGKTIVATGFEKLPKVQQIAQPGHTDCRMSKCEEQKGANDHHHDDIFHLMEHYLVEGLLVSISNTGSLHFSTNGPSTAQPLFRLFYSFHTILQI